MNFNKHSILRHQVVTTFGSRMILLPCNNNKNKVIRRRNNSNATKNGNAILQISSGGGGGGGGSFPFFARIIARCISSSSSRSSTGSTPPAKKEEGEEETKNSSNQFAKEKNSSSFSSSATSSSSSLWEDPVNRKKFFTFAETQLNINDPEDWYSVTRRELDQIASFYGGSEGGGHSLLKKYYNNSLIKALADVYPEINWMPWRFSAARERVPAGFWDDPANHRKFFDWAATTDKLRIRNVPEDWYKISSEEVERLGARSFLNKHYGKSLIRALMRLYPEVEWLPWRFESGAPRGFWDDPANRRWFFDWAAQQLGIFHSNNNIHNHNHNNGNNNNNNSGNSNSHEGWYQISIEDITRLGGWGLLRQIYGGSLIKALASVYPEFEWHPWRFRNVPRGFWQSDKATHRQFFDWAAKQLGIPNNNNNNNSNSNNNNISSSSSSNDNNNNNSDDDFREGWYRVSSKEIERLGGSGLLDSYYGGSLYRALSSVYPEFEWHPWRFGVSRNPNHMMTMTMKKNQDSTSSSSCDKSDLVKYVEYLARALPIRELDDWYRVSVKQLRKIGGYQIIAQHGGRYLALKAVYPQHNWDESRFTKSGSQGRRSSQWQMKVVMQQLFPDEEIIEEYQHPALRFHNDESQELITMDIWVPSLSLALEYQGEQHYHDVNFFGSAEKQQRLDQAKIAQCKQAGITLVCVPYWWDQTAESLAATICAARPDLAESNSRLARAAAAGTEPVPRDAPEPSRTR